MIDVNKIESLKNLTQRQQDIIKDNIRISPKLRRISYDVNKIYDLLINSGSQNKLSRVTILTFCIKESNRLKSLDRAKKNRQKWAKSNPLLYRAQTLYQGAKSRTKAKEEKYSTSLPFDLDVNWIYTKLKKGKCEVSNVPFVIKEYESSDTYQKVHPQAPSLDRIDSDGYYTKDNVRVVCDCLNKMFGPHDDEEIFPIVYKYVETNKSKYSYTVTV